MKEYKLDDKDRKILMILQENARESLTNMSREIGLSVDAIHKRIKKMNDSDIISTRVAINPYKIGYPLIADIKIKLKDTTKSDVAKMIQYFKNHPRIVELFNVMGDWDLTLVVLAKNANDLAEVTNEIKYKYNKNIADWRSILILKQYKFEEYDMMKL